MSGYELALCLSAVACSSVSQLFMKSASQQKNLKTFLFMIGIGGALQLGAVVLAVLALRTLQLTQLIPFAAAAYFLVPLGSHIVFNERILPRFWLGTMLIMVGIVCTYEVRRQPIGKGGTHILTAPEVHPEPSSVHPAVNRTKLE